MNRELINNNFLTVTVFSIKQNFTILITFTLNITNNKHRKHDNFSAVEQLIATKIKVVIHIVYLCVLCRVGYRSHLNRYQYRYRYLEFGTGTQRYLFRYFTLCDNKNNYFSEKISPKLSILTFWTIGPYKFFFSSRNVCVLFFSDNQMKAWNIYLFLIKWKWNPFIFWQTNRGLLLKLIHGIKIVWIFL